MLFVSVIRADYSRISARESWHIPLGSSTILGSSAAYVLQRHST